MNANFVMIPRIPFPVAIFFSYMQSLITLMYNVESQPTSLNISICFLSLKLQCPQCSRGHYMLYCDKSNELNSQPYLVVKSSIAMYSMVKLPMYDCCNGLASFKFIAICCSRSRCTCGGRKDTKTYSSLLAALTLLLLLI